MGGKFSNKPSRNRSIPLVGPARNKIKQMLDLAAETISDGDVLVYDAATDTFYGRKIEDIGALDYKGLWNASTNTPELVSSVGSKGDYYKVSVKGTTTLDGNSDREVGDLALFNGTVWQRLAGGESYVDLTDNQTIAGIKTFSSSPIVPTPTTPTQATNKGTSEAFAVAMAIAL